MSNLEVIMMNKDKLKSSLEQVSLSIYQASTKLDEEKLAIELKPLMLSAARLYTIGIGKSGFIAQKIASTFQSLGKPAYFLHPTEALHGDLGMVREDDIAILISNSGTTEEIQKLLPFLPIPKKNRIGLIGNINSPIAQACEVILDCHVEKESCLNNQAPTTSTSVALAMGDALAVYYEHLAGLTKEDFAKNHPGGKLGKSLSLKVSHLMLPLEECPILNKNQTLMEALLQMTDKPIGLCAICDENLNLEGIIVDGDIRRSLAKNPKALDLSIEEVLNINPISIGSDDLASAALNLMQKRDKPIQVLPVLKNKKLMGALRLHDILKSGL